MSDAIDEIDGSKAPLMDHLIELRRRLLVSIAALVVAFAIAFTQSKTIFAFLVQPLVRAEGGHHTQLIYTKLYEAFFVEVKVAAFAALCLAFPVIANQLWAFVAPGLYRNEKRAFLPCGASRRPSSSNRPSKFEQQAAFPKWKNKWKKSHSELSELSELSEVFSQVLQNVAVRVDLAFQSFFRHVKQGETPGYPRVKGHGQYDSITYPQAGFGIVQGRL